jgi:two-component system chemotaxis family response regulator WspR
LLLPDTDAEGGKHIADMIVENIDKLNLEHLGSPVSKKVTVSIGVPAVIPQKKDLPNNFLNASDMALYRAKAEGRNCYRVCC